MELFYSETSPYARKVRLVIRERGLERAVREISCNPFAAMPELIAANALGQVPALVTDDGWSLYDSPVICDYLDSLSPGDRLIPQTGTQRWRVLRWEALADGIADAAYNIVMERRRAQGERSNDWIRRWQGDIERALERVEQDMAELPDTLTLAQLALGAALGYLDLRLPELQWRTGREATARWYDEFTGRLSMRQTCPQTAKNTG